MHRADDRPAPDEPDSGSPPSLNPHAHARGGRRRLPPERYVAGIRDGDRVLLGRAITLVESTRAEDQALAQEVLQRCLPHAGDSVRLGITGVPGVGKSTFIEALGTRLTGQGRRVAVLAVDPTSERTGGSILGDKTRMPTLAADERAFIRPSPAAGSLGGVARRTREAILLCEAAGFDTVFVETVGVGQSETVVHSMVDFFLLLALTGAGDELQGIKRGIIEMADAIAITKADGSNRDRARATRNAYRSALSLFPLPPSGWRPRVLTCSAVTGEGIDEVWEAVTDFLSHTRSSGFFTAQRREQARYWLRQTIEAELRADFLAHPAVAQRRPILEEEVLAGTLSPFTAAKRLLEVYLRGRKGEREKGGSG